MAKTAKIIPIRADIPISPREQEAADLRLAGKKLKDVGTAMGVSHQQAWNLLRRYYEKTGDTKVLGYAPRSSDAERLEKRKARHKRAAQKYAERHPDRIKTQARKWRKNNADYVREKNRKWKVDNPARVKESMIAWREVPKNRIRSIVKSRIADAIRRGIPLDQKAMLALVENPPTHCQISGVLLDYSAGRGRNVGNSPSIDRIDPNRGYVKGNIAVVTHRINTIKSFGTAAEHRIIAEFLERHK